MAITVTRFVNTASVGGDGTTNATTGATAAYAGIRAALTAEFGARPNLVINDEVLKIICEGGDDSSALNYAIPNFTTDATRYLWLFVAAANRHAGKYDTTKYRVTSNHSAGVFSNAPLNVTIEGLQLVSTVTTGAATPVISLPALANVVLTLIQCVIHSTSTTTAPSESLIANSGALVKSIKARNCVFSGPGLEAIRWAFASATSTIIVYNCTMVGQEGGVKLDGGEPTIHLKNTVVERRAGATASAYLTSGTVTSATNVSDDATSPQVALRNLTASYVDKANWDLHLTATDTVARDAGTDLSADAQWAFSDDVDGTTRPIGSAWDIGADEAASAAGQPTTKRGGGSPFSRGDASLVTRRW